MAVQAWKWEAMARWQLRDGEIAALKVHLAAADDHIGARCSDRGALRAAERICAAGF